MILKPKPTEKVQCYVARVLTIRKRDHISPNIRFSGLETLLLIQKAPNNQAQSLFALLRLEKLIIKNKK